MLLCSTSLPAIDTIEHLAADGIGRFRTLARRLEPAIIAEITQVRTWS